MFTGAGAGHPPGRLLPGSLFRIPHSQEPFHLILKQLLLLFAGTVGRADPRLQPRGTAVIHHLLQSRIHPAVHGVPAFELRQFRDLKFLRQGIRSIHYQQFPRRIL